MGVFPQQRDQQQQRDQNDREDRHLRQRLAQLAGRPDPADVAACPSHHGTLSGSISDSSNPAPTWKVCVVSRNPPPSTASCSRVMDENRLRTLSVSRPEFEVSNPHCLPSDQSQASIQSTA